MISLLNPYFSPAKTHQIPAFRSRWSIIHTLSYHLIFFSFSLFRLTCRRRHNIAEDAYAATCSDAAGAVGLRNRVGQLGDRKIKKNSRITRSKSQPATTCTCTNVCNKAHLSKVRLTFLYVIQTVAKIETSNQKQSIEKTLRRLEKRGWLCGAWNEAVQSGWTWGLTFRSKKRRESGGEATRRRRFSMCMYSADGWEGKRV